MARMSVQARELPIGRLPFQDFLVASRSGIELFSARLMEHERSLQITWTRTLRANILVKRLDQLQELAGGSGSIVRIWGQASYRLRDLIRIGRFNAAGAAQLLRQSLGGDWRVDIIRVPNSVPLTWDVVATRLGD